MKKIFSLLAAVLFAGSMMATEVIFTNADFAGQGTANTGSEVTATKSGVTFTCNKGYSADESLRCYAHGELTISASATIEKINFTTTGGKTGGLDAEVEVNATQYHVADLASQARFTEIKVTLAGETPALGAWNQVVFSAAAAADAIPADSIFASDKEGFEAKIADSGNKMVIDANDCRFGTAQGYEMYNFRLKSGGASGSDKNFITISVPTAGKLGLAVRTGSNSATDRVLYVLQDGDTLYNGIIQESMAIEVIENEDTIKVYPYVTVDAKAGNVIVRYSGALNFYAFGFNASLAPEPMDTVPATAPAAPKQKEENVMALYSSYYATNNYNFNVLGWGGVETWQTLKLGEDSVSVLACKDMKWEIMTNWDANHYDMSAYEKLHADIWVPAAAKVKITFEALGTNDGGSGYKDGVVFNLKKGWNAIDADLAAWNYDFEDMRYIIFEGFQTPAGESFEGNPFAITNIYFWHAPLLTAAEAREAALAGSTEEVYVEGYVTEIVEAWNSQYKNISFWIADEVDGGQVFEIFRAKCDSADAPVVGDAILAKGKLTKYTKDDVTTPELAAGCTFVIIPRHEADTVVIDAITYGEVYTDYFLTDGAVDVLFTTQPIVGDKIVGDGYIVVLDILPEDANDITGVYSVDSMTLDLSYSGANHIVGTDTTSIDFVDGTVVFQVIQKSVEQNLAQLAIVGELEAEDGTVFIISAATVVYYEFIDEEGIEEIMAENEGKTIKFVQNGQVYILRDNKVYGIRGERVR